MSIDGSLTMWDAVKVENYRDRHGEYARQARDRAKRMRSLGDTHVRGFTDMPKTLTALRRLAKAPHPNTVYGVATTMEEVGLRGAQTSVAAVKPNVAIALDVGIAHDTPGSLGDGDEKLGGGAGILVYDASMIPNVKLRNLAIEICDKQKIPYHLGTVERGGTDAGRFHIYDTGVPSLVIFIPTRYIHSHSTIMDRKDYDAAVRLLVELTKRLDRKTVDNL